MRRTTLLLAALIAGATPVASAERIAIGTGGTGGVFYVVGAGIADVINKKMPGVTASAEVTGASIENVRRVSMGEMKLAFSSASTLYDAKHGEKPFGKPQNIAAIAYLYPATLQVAVLSKTGVKTLEGLKNVRTSFGPPGGNSAVIAQRLLEAYGAFNKSKVQFLSYAEATNAIKDGNLDATCVLAGVPASALIELATNEDVTFLPVEGAPAQALVKKYPYYKLISIRAGAYKGQDKAVPAVGDPVILFTRGDAPEKFVYDMTKTIFDNLADWQGVHPAAKAVSVKTAPETPIPLHPGAAKYFAEAGKAK
jgi:TRAP transporter TAXI family solute receptor